MATDSSHPAASAPLGRRRYVSSARLLHWLMAALVILAYVLINTRHQFERGSLERQWVTLGHFWLGLLVLALVLPRLWVRHRHAAPAIEPPVSVLMRRVAHVTHYGLYGFLLLQPLLGLLTVWLTVGEVKIPASSWSLPSPWSVDRELAGRLKGLHVWLGTAFYWVIGLHVVAALWHHLVRRDDTLRRML